MRILLLASILLLSACDYRRDIDTPQNSSENLPLSAIIPVATPQAGPLRYGLSLAVNQGGTVQSQPIGIDCGTRCAAQFDADTVVTLTATAARGFVFSGWQGACQGAASSCMLTMSQDQRVQAQFTQDTGGGSSGGGSSGGGSGRSLPLAVSFSGNGRVQSNPGGIDCGAVCSADFAENSDVTLTVSPDAGWELQSIRGACNSSPCTIRMNQRQEVMVVFAQIHPPAPTGTWLLGDMHVHDDHSADGSALRQGFNGQAPGNVSVADQIQRATQAGLQWLPLTDHRTYTQHYDPLWESSNLLLIPGEEANGGPHCTAHGAVDTVVQGANPSGTPDFVNLQQSIWDAHAQNAVWAIAHPDDGEVNADGSPNIKANAVGMDTIETWNRGSGVDLEVDYAENRWNAGFRFGMNGGSDNHFRELWDAAGPGQPRTGVLAEWSSERAILDGLRAGRTRISNSDAAAPTLLLEADFTGDGVFESVCGDEITVPAGRPGQLRITALNGTGATVQLYKSPGRSAGVWQSFQPLGSPMQYTVNITAETSPVWYRLEARGPGPVAGINTNQVRDPFSNPPTQDMGTNELRAVCSPIFIAPSVVNPQPEIAIPADAGIDDGGQIAIGRSGNRFAGFADVAVSNGIEHLVAEIHDDQHGTQISYRRRNASGFIGPEVLLVQSGFARFAKVAAQGSQVWVVWQDERASQVPRRGAIYLRHSTDGGASWQPEQLVRSIAGRAEHPDIALTPDGKPLVVWQEIAAGKPFDIWGQIIGVDATPINLSAPGKRFTAGNSSPICPPAPTIPGPVLVPAPPCSADSRSAIYPASVWPVLALHADGRMAVGWQDNRTDPDPLWTGSISGDTFDVDNWQTMVTVRQSNTSPWSAPVGFGQDDKDDEHPALAWAANGTLVAAWNSRPLVGAGANLRILSSESTDNGLTWSAPSAVGLDTNAMSQFPKLGHNPSGQVQAVWYDNRSPDWRWRVAHSTRSSAGAWTTASIIPSKGINTWPSIDKGSVVFSSTRNALRMQRDKTQQIVVLNIP